MTRWLYWICIKYYEICFDIVNSLVFVVGYVDLDYAKDIDFRMSTTCYVFTISNGKIS